MIVYTRGLNRIRRYFVDLDPSVQEHLIMGTRDDYPPFWVRMGDQAQLIAVINTATTGIFVAGVVYLFDYSAFFIAIVGVLAGIGSYFAHYLILTNLANKFSERFAKDKRWIPQENFNI